MLVFHDWRGIFEIWDSPQKSLNIFTRFWTWLHKITASWPRFTGQHCPATLRSWAASPPKPLSQPSIPTRIWTPSSTWMHKTEALLSTQDVREVHCSFKPLILITAWFFTGANFTWEVKKNSTCSTNSLSQIQNTKCFNKLVSLLTPCLLFL